MADLSAPASNTSGEGQPFEEMEVDDSGTGSSGSEHEDQPAEAVEQIQPAATGQPQQDAQPIYHEKQSMQFCGLHTTNNVLQEARFSKQDFDTICDTLTPGTWFSFNVHRSSLGLGNYDVNVLTAAFQQCDKELIWFNKDLDPELELNLANIYAFVLNRPSSWKVGAWLNFKHWYGVRQINGGYYNLDSELSEPAVIGNDQEFLAYLRGQIELPSSYVFLVVGKQIADTNGWRRVQDQNQNQEAEAGAGAEAATPEESSS